MRSMLAAGALAALCAGAPGAHAADALPGAEEVPQPGPAPGRQVASPAQAPAARAGVDALGLRFYPELVLAYTTDDNLFATGSGRVRDSAWMIAPALWARSDWSRHALRLHAAYDAVRYDERGSENSDDWQLSAEGRYDLSDDANVYAGVRQARDHEDRESPDARNGTEPTRYDSARAYAGVFRQFGPVSLRLGATVQDLDFRDTPFSGGTINNDDRDRRRYTAGVRAAYALTPDLEPFVQFALDNRRYTVGPDDLGVLRDSDGWRALAGARLGSAGKLKLEAYAGLMHQDYEDARLPDVTKPMLGANLVWQIDQATRLSAYFDRTIEETTVFAIAPPATLQLASSYLNSYGGATLQHRYGERVATWASASFSRSDFQGIARQDDYLGGELGVSYRLARHLVLEASYLHRRLNSDVPGEDFRRNQFFVRAVLPY